ncbi:MAG: hypothetical protein EAZ88_24725, partial [Oscillatoriales cyanobacterium]
MWGVVNNTDVYFIMILRYFVGRVHQQYITITNHLYKPAPTPPITHINLKFASHRKNVHDDCWLGGGGFLKLFVSGDYGWRTRP